MIGQATTAVTDDAELVPSLLSDELQEYHRTVLRHLKWPSAGNGHGGDKEKGTQPALRILGVTSCSRGEGVSTVAAQLAATAAEMQDGRVLLVDANLAHPTLHEVFDVDLCPGLAESLSSPNLLDGSVQPTCNPRLSILAAGEPNGSLPRAFDTAGIGQVMDALRPEYELVVVDMPPAGQQSAALRLAGALDGVLMVVEAERVHFEVALRARQLLGRAGANVLGAVLNKRRTYTPAWLREEL